MPFIVSWQRRQLSENSGTITFKVKYQLFIEVFVEVFVGRSTQPPVNLHLVGKVQQVLPKRRLVGKLGGLWEAWSKNRIVESF